MSPARLLLPIALSLLACGPPILDREEAAAVLAFGAIPAVHARAAEQVRVSASAAEGLPVPTVVVRGAHGGEARLEFNLVAAAVGLAGEGLLFNVHYSDYSNDGAVRLSGDVAILANFQFDGSAYDDPYADLKLTLAGTARVSGAYSDELHARISLTTRIHDLEFREDSVRMRLDGYLDGQQQRFEFHEEDVTALWAQFLEPRR